uniref:Uncharacterized protein n=1 Tax=Avena sativa TaxID=4498 RepID=A0ACD5XN50_AVESA
MIEIVRNYHLLYKCTKDILSVIKPTEEDRNKRLGAIEEIVNSIRLVDALTGAAVIPFGSFASNLYAKSGDLDVSVEPLKPFRKRGRKKNGALREVRKALQIKGVSSDVQYIPTARVPVLKYVSNHFGISCDISINNCPGRIKSRVLYWINTLDPRFRDMVLLVKEWAKAQNINDPRNGTMNSYTLCLLVIFHFQTSKPAIFPPMKEIYDVNMNIANGTGGFNEEHLDQMCMENIAKFRRRDTGQRYQTSLSLSYLLADFFDKFCGIATGGFHYDTYTGQLNQSQGDMYRMLTVEDPFARYDDAARTVDVPGLFRIANAFRHARDPHNPAPPSSSRVATAAAPRPARGRAWSASPARPLSARGHRGGAASCARPPRVVTASTAAAPRPSGRLPRVVAVSSAGGGVVARGEADEVASAPPSSHPHPWRGGVARRRPR